MLSQSGNSLVMVEMLTQEDERTVLEHKSDIKSSVLSSVNLDHVGIRELNYEELWNKVQELTVVKRVVPSIAMSSIDQSTTSTGPTEVNEELAAVIEEVAEDEANQDYESIDPRLPADPK